MGNLFLDVSQNPPTNSVSAPMSRVIGRGLAFIEVLKQIFCHFQNRRPKNSGWLKILLWNITFSWNWNYFFVEFEVIKVMCQSKFPNDPKCFCLWFWKWHKISFKISIEDRFCPINSHDQREEDRNKKLTSFGRNCVRNCIFSTTRITNTVKPEAWSATRLSLYGNDGRSRSSCSRRCDPRPSRHSNLWTER